MCVAITRILPKRTQARRGQAASRYLSVLLISADRDHGPFIREARGGLWIAGQQDPEPGCQASRGPWPQLLSRGESFLFLS